MRRDSEEARGGTYAISSLALNIADKRKQLRISREEGVNYARDQLSPLMFTAMIITTIIIIIII